MANLNSLISQRLKGSEPSTKMAQMAEKSAAGNLSSFSGLFQINELSSQEKSSLEAILKLHSKDPLALSKDLKELIAITSEVKAINHQAALLHGERIKKVHALLARYREGAFSAWMISIYGNRQTPYNLMQYYDFYQSLPLELRPKAEEMPRQAIYSLASREGNLKQKIQLVAHYKGETKAELLFKIRDLFPLAEQDKRRENPGDAAISSLQKIHTLLSRKQTRLTVKQKETLKELLQALTYFLK